MKIENQLNSGFLWAWGGRIRGCLLRRLHLARVVSTTGLAKNVRLKPAGGQSIGRGDECAEQSSTDIRNLHWILPVATSELLGCRFISGR